MVASRTPDACLLVLLMAGSVGCGVLYVDDQAYEDKLTQVSDKDGDGHKGADWRGGHDCDDGNIDIHPDAEEVCDGVDNNCDGETDEETATDAATWYLDNDGDGFGDAANPRVACEVPSGFVDDSSDCDDRDPGSTNTQTDGDCDGTVYAEDCDDEDSAVHPGAEEVCDGIDNNCDGTVDEDSAVDAQTWYADVDGDSHGDAANTTTACQQPSGFVSNNNDCNDASAYAYPGANEICDGLDNDCDTIVDEDDAFDARTWYADADVDGYGDASSTDIACDQPLGYVSAGTDCNDGDAAIHPAATEVCDGVDNNCDGNQDEANDLDNDGYDDLCDGDCNDADSSINPGEDERCDPLNVDEDCDGLADNDDPVALNTSAFFVDNDLDGYGGSSTGDLCDLVSGFSTSTGDCDDSNPAINPGASELCSTAGVDDDCDGEVDEDSAADATSYYPDWDGDGYGLDSGVVTSCGPTNSGPTTDSGTSWPGSAINDWTTVTDDISLTGCGSVDDVTVDVDISHTYRYDLDIQLTSPSGTEIWLWSYRGGSESDLVATFTDSGSSSNDDAASPLGDIEPTDPLSNFDGEASTGTWTLTINDDDSADDGTLNSWGVNISCGGSTLVANGGDCDESDASIHPGATEIYGDAVDNDCDGTADNLDLLPVDTASWTPTNLYGPRVSSRSDGIYLAWIADSYEVNSIAVYDGAVIATFDPAAPTSGPTSEMAFLDSASDAGSLGEVFDFGVDATNFYLARSLVGGSGNELVVDTVRKTSPYLERGSTSSLVGGQQPYEDLQLLLMEDSSNSAYDFVSAVGCGTSGMETLVGGGQFMEQGTALSASSSVTPSVCAPYLRSSSWQPYFEAYYYASNDPQADGWEYNFDGSQILSFYGSCSFCQQAAAIKQVRNNGQWVGAYAWSSTLMGSNLAIHRANGNDSYWSKSREVLVPEYFLTLDVDISTSNQVYVCGVGASGSAWFYSMVVNYSNSAAPTGLEIVPVSGAYEDCSISISDSNLLALALRNGNDIYMAVTQVP